MRIAGIGGGCRASSLAIPHPYSTHPLESTIALQNTPTKIPPTKITPTISTPTIITPPPPPPPTSLSQIPSTLRNNFYPPFPQFVPPTPSLHLPCAPKISLPIPCHPNSPLPPLLSLIIYLYTRPPPLFPFSPFWSTRRSKTRSPVHIKHQLHPKFPKHRKAKPVNQP